MIKIDNRCEQWSRACRGALPGYELTGYLGIWVRVDWAPIYDRGAVAYLWNRLSMPGLDQNKNKNWTKVHMYTHCILRYFTVNQCQRVHTTITRHLTTGT